MKSPKQKTLTILSILLVFTFLMLGATSASAQEKSADQWEYDLEVYGWLPTMYVNTATDEEIKLTLRDILNSLRFMAMVDFSAKKDKWSFNTDAIYVNLGGKTRMHGDIEGHPVTSRVDVDMRSFITTFGAGYRFFDNGKTELEALGAIRYLYIKQTVDFSVEDLSKTVRGDGDAWDGVIGLEGKTTINDKWYVNYLGDVGTGDSKITYQLKLGGGYKFNKFTGTFGYRYQRWNFDKGSSLENMYISGPYVGALWTF